MLFVSNKLFQQIPSDIKKSIWRWNFLLLMAVILQIIAWFLALYYIGADTDQGNVYRIIFVHVPIAWCAFFWIFIAAIFALFTLLKPIKSDSFDRSSYACVEVGTIFTVLLLITGSIWGRPTWGVWWDWDPRLTSSLVMLLVSCGYLILRSFTPDIRNRRTVSSIVAIMNAINVPIVYYSVNMWRSLHQPQTFFKGSHNVSSDILFVLFYNLLIMFFLSVVIYKIKRQAIAAKESLEIARGCI